MYNYLSLLYLSDNLVEQNILVKGIVILALEYTALFLSCNISIEKSVESLSQISSVTQSCLTLCDSMDCSMPGFPVHHQLHELAQTHVHQVSDPIQPSHPLYRST